MGPPEAAQRASGQQAWHIERFIQRTHVELAQWGYNDLKMKPYNHIDLVKSWCGYTRQCVHGYDFKSMGHDSGPDTQTYHLGCYSQVKGSNAATKGVIL